MPSTLAARSESRRDSVNDSQILEHAHVFGGATRINPRLVHKIAPFHRLLLGQRLDQRKVDRRLGQFHLQDRPRFLKQGAIWAQEKVANERLERSWASEQVQVAWHAARKCITFDEFNSRMAAQELLSHLERE